MTENQKGFQTVNLHGCTSGTIATPVIGENGNWFIGNDDTGVNAKGLTGAEGVRGSKGEQGEIGPAGPQGIQGCKGDKGDRGDTGSVGPVGPQGLKGDRGETGLPGVQGPKGDKGETGIQGPKGDKGPGVEDIMGRVNQLDRELNMYATGHLIIAAGATGEITYERSLNVFRLYINGIAGITIEAYVWTTIGGPIADEFRSKAISNTLVGMCIAASSVIMIRINNENGNIEVYSAEQIPAQYALFGDATWLY